MAIGNGILAPGNSPGTLTIGGNLSLTSASVLDYELGQAGTVGGALNDLTVVGGDLVLDGTLNVAVSAGGTFGPGLYRLISYGGTLTDNGLAQGSQPAGSTSLVQTSIAGQVNLVDTTGLTLDFWDGGSAIRNNGVADGGSGVWQSSAGNDNWTESTGALNAPHADGSFAIFAGAPGIVTIDDSLGAVVSAGMQFATSGYLLQGQPITLAAGGNTLRVGDGTGSGIGYVATIASELTGAGGIDKTDLGTLVLSGANTYTGGTTISAGTLQLGNSSASGSVVGDITDNGTLAFDRSDAFAFGNIVSGTGAVSKLGANTLTFTGDNNYSGGTTISAGTLQLGNGGTTGSITGDVIDNGTLAFNRSDAIGFGGVISGSGSVSKLGANTLTFTGDNTYSGGTIIGAGTLQIGNGGTTGSIVGNVTDNGTLAFNRSDDVAFAGIVSGTGALAQNGSGTTTLTSANTYTGGTTINAGILQLGDGGSTGSIVGDVADNGMLAFNRSDAVTFAGIVSGTGALAQNGGGTTTLTAANTYTGGTTINAGTLQIGAGGTTGSITGNVVDNGILAFDRADAIAFDGIISGSGGVSKLGANTLTFTGDNTYSGTTTIGAGTLQIGNGGSSGAIVGNVADNGALVFDRSNDLTYAGAISGAGTLAQIGSGATTLSGNSGMFSGSTAATGGMLRVDGTLGNAGSTIFVSNGGTLSGNGILGGDVAIADGTLAPGNSPGTLTIGGNLSLTGASVLDYEFGQAYTVGGPLNDLTVVGGDLVLDGTLNVAASAGGGYGPGLYRIISYGGALTDNGLALGSRPAGTSSFVQTSVAGQVNLIDTTGLALGFWDGGSGGRNNGVVGGGDGVWQSSAGNDNWTDATGTVNAPYANGIFAIFTGAPGTVTVDDSLGTVVSGGMQFATDGYALRGGPITLAAGVDIVRVGDGTASAADYTATIASQLTGTGGIDKTDLGTLVLTGANNYSGGTTISAGTLKLGNGGTTGSITGDVTDKGALVFDRSDDPTYTGAISGSGSVTQQGTGTLTLGGANSYTGATAVDAGTLRAAAADVFAQSASVTVAGGAALDLAGFDQTARNLSGAGAVTLGAATLMVRADADTRLDGTLTGTGVLVKTGAAAWTLAGAGSRVGGVSVDAGELRLAYTGAMTVDGDYTTATGAGSVISDTSTQLAVAGAFTQQTGSKLEVTVGALPDIAAGSAILGGELTIHGYTDGPEPLRASDVANGQRFVLIRTTGGISGDFDTNPLQPSSLDYLLHEGSVTRDGLDYTLGFKLAWTDGNASSATGNFTLDAGTSFNVDLPLRDQVGQFDHWDGRSLVKNGAGWLVLSGQNSYSGGTTLNDGLLTVSADANLGAASGALTLNGGTLQVATGFASTRPVTLAGASTLEVAAGTLQLGGSLDGAGRLLKSGGGAIDFTGNGGAFSGGIEVGTGLFRANGVLGGTLDVDNGATLGGGGAIGGLNARAGATVAPGNSIGTLTVNGNALFAAGSLYQVEIAPDGTSDRLQVNGAATLQGGAVRVLAVPGDYSGIGSYTIVSATSGVDGRFAGLDAHFAFLAPTLGYDANNVYLELVRNTVDFSRYAGTGNQRGAAAGAQSLGNGNRLYDAIAALPDDPALIRAAFDQISGEAQASFKSALIEDSHFARDAANDRLLAVSDDLTMNSTALPGYGRDGGFATSDPATAQSSFWARAYGAAGRFDGETETSRLKHDTGGLLVGTDGQAGDWRLGVLAGVGRTRLDVPGRGSDGSNRDAQLGAYAGAQWGDLSLRVGAIYGRHDISTRRRVDFPGFSDRLRSDYGADSMQWFGELGYHLQAGATALEPFANLASVRLDSDAFAERGAESAVHADAQDMRVTFATLGLRASREFIHGDTRISARGLLGWRHASGDITPRSIQAFSGGDDFSVTGSPIARDAALLEAGVDVKLGANAILGISYQGQWSDKARENGALATFTWEF